MRTSNIISVGLAMFAILFGAGNVVFPLILGRTVGDKLWFGLAGFVLTAVIVPMIGLISTMLCDGEYKKFLGKLGKIPGFILAFLCMTLIGPFGLTARCITISYASVAPYLSTVTLLSYSIFTALLVFAVTVRKNSVIDILGKVLGPLKVILLSAVVIKGLITPVGNLPVITTKINGLLEGLSSGYATADLLGTIFFSGLILSGLKKGLGGKKLTPKELASVGLKAGAFGALLLGLMYTGFCIVAAFYGPELAGADRSAVFSLLAQLVLGDAGGLLANMTVAVSTLTTAIALNVIFAEYLSAEVFLNKINYHQALVLSILIMATMSNFGFSGIMTLVMPIISAIYPAFVVLALVNVAQILYGFKWIKTPVWTTLVITLIVQYWNYFACLCG